MLMCPVTSNLHPFLYSIHLVYDVFFSFLFFYIIFPIFENAGCPLLPLSSFLHPLFDPFCVPPHTLDRGTHVCIITHFRDILIPPSCHHKISYVLSIYIAASISASCPRWTILTAYIAVKKNKNKIKDILSVPKVNTADHK